MLIFIETEKTGYDSHLCNSKKKFQTIFLHLTYFEWSFWNRVLMVLGAGRGPLVNASLRAARQADRKLRVYAVEKNPNAVITWVELCTGNTHCKHTNTRLLLFEQVRISCVSVHHMSWMWKLWKTFLSVHMSEQHISFLTVVLNLVL